MKHTHSFKNIPNNKLYLILYKNRICRERVLKEIQLRKKKLEIRD